MTRLTAGRYRDLCAIAGDALDHPSPEIRKAGSDFGWTVAVYLLGHRDPVTNKLIIDYVGSAVRPSSDAGARTREHLRDLQKKERFTCQVALPLRRDLAVGDVRRLEGEIARALGVPRWCQRVPGGRRTA
ncbi:hypothetical protein HPO96_19600 [Kribbella sandramycini]|uniref:Uncharacterized protein n=1 Tax=Kribbella sandramycini TaxID=60450 RepID=A0A7Y4P0A8_9ACTN|nr:hypothetical protein [Kribbella sandramycini]MBB6564754.1 hypothetical protein [Kribbella sandramycini]NOL42456.1 hypothetical protein [Kribbella sandramycini]